MDIQSTCIAWGRALPKRLAELADVLNCPIPLSWSNIDVRGICLDTRNLTPGDLFVAIPGADRDGSDYARAAVDLGAVAVVSERELDLSCPVLTVRSARRALAQLSDAFYDHPTRQLFTVGVTGTNGKTTVCHMAADLIGREETLLLSTVRNVGLGMSDLTTLTSTLTQQLAHDAVQQGLSNLVLEASSAGIAQDRVHAIDFDACVFTNLSAEHQHYHDGLVPYRKAKIKLFETLKPDAWAILNADDPLAPLFADATPARVRTFGEAHGADLQLVSCYQETRSSHMSVVDRAGSEAHIHLHLPGPHNVSNALAALSVGLAKGLPLDVLVPRLECLTPIPGRSEYYRRKDGLTAVVDFAHNASSLQAMIRLLRSEYSKVIVVFGCPGDGEHAKRVDMGRVCAHMADSVILTSDNPKDEDPFAIAKAIQSGMGDRPSFALFEPDRGQAIQAALAQAQAGDVVLLAGKGHETIQLVRSRRLPYSDGAVLRDLGFRLEI